MLQRLLGHTTLMMTNRYYLRLLVVMMLLRAIRGTRQWIIWEVGHNFYLPSTEFTFSVVVRNSILHSQTDFLHIGHHK
jgi:hypothetical protein